MPVSSSHGTDANKKIGAARSGTRAGTVPGESGPTVAERGRRRARSRGITVEKSDAGAAASVRELGTWVASLVPFQVGPSVGAEHIFGLRLPPSRTPGRRGRDAQGPDNDEWLAAEQRRLERLIWEARPDSERLEQLVRGLPRALRGS